MNLDCLAHDVVGRRLLSLGLLLGCVVPAFAQVTAVKYRSIELDCDRVEATGFSQLSVQSGPGLPVGVFGSLNKTPAGTLPYYSLGIGPIGLDPNTLFDLSPFFSLTNALGRTQATFPTSGSTVGTQLRFQAAVVDPLAPQSFALSDTVLRTVQAGPTTAYAAGPLVSATGAPLTARNVATGDIDGDGDEDVYVCGAGVQDELYLANGAGGFQLVTAASGLFNAPFGSNDAEFVDLDKDNLLDLVCVSNQGLTVFANNAATVPSGPYGWLGFTQVAFLTAPGVQPNFNAVDTGDVDNDGDIDILVGASSGVLTGAQNRLWLNLHLQGTPFAFLDATGSTFGFLPANLDNTEDVELADIDGDGDLDAFIANFYCLQGTQPSQAGWQDVLLLNNGGGLFTSVVGTQFPNQVIPTGGGQPGVVTCDNSIDCEFGDVDNDGDLDLVVGNWQVAAASTAPFPGISYEPNRLYLNNAGVFALSVGALQSSATPTNDLEFLDYDRDGNLDLIEINGNFQTAAPAGAPGVRNQLLRNSGSGTFVVDTTIGAAIRTGLSNSIGVEVADLWPNRHAVDIVVATVNGGVITFRLQ